MQTNGSIKSLPRSGLLLPLNEVWGTCKMNIELALKSRSYILNLDHVKLSLGQTDGYADSKSITNSVYYQKIESNFTTTKDIK